MSRAKVRVVLTSGQERCAAGSDRRSEGRASVEGIARKWASKTNQSSSDAPLRGKLLLRFWQKLPGSLRAAFYLQAVT